ncbi:ATP-binding protein [Jatrophihabitans sp.]|uniref:ATP-binding protein n=1 Tax=Jatrophihabitans sp. TaxID=1932789 RepID=UPI0030C77221|nr:sensor histidine kinase [Jatrophihabitans sp.]
MSVEQAVPAPRPLWRRLIFSRYAPYQAVLVLSTLSPALPHTTSPNNTWWALAALDFVIAAGVGVVAASRPSNLWLATLGPLLVLPGIQWLRNADGNSGAGFSSLLYLPVIWFAFYGRRFQVVLAVIGSIAVLVLPIVIVGSPQYPASAWRGTTLFLLVIAVIGPLVHELVQRSQDANTRLTVSETQFRAAFDDAPVGTMLSGIGGDVERTMLRVNRALGRMLGYSADELLGHDVVEFIHPDDVAEVVRRRQSLTSGQRAPRAEQRLMHKSGRVVWVSMSFSVIHDDEGRPLQIISQIEDISARRESDKALLESLESERAAAERMRAMAKSRRDLVSGVSHDLRTPITSASGFAELLAEGDAGPLNDEQLTMLSTVRRNLDRIAAIVDDLLAFSRTDSEAAPRADPIDLGDVVEAAVQSMSLQAIERGQHLSYTNELRGVSINGDANRLDRALTNLLSNAVKFTPPDGIVTVTAINRGDAAVIQVADTGIGIPPDEVEKIFDQYFRATAAREESINGTGLGLAIVRAVTEQHSGSVEVSSEVGTGTTFTLTLPLG